MRIKLLALAMLCLAVSAAQAADPPQPLNDTGITFSGAGGRGNASLGTCDLTSHPKGQDCQYGRDPAAATNNLTKTGGGNAGFDFTALDGSGTATSPGSHECVKDNVTGLVWSTQTLSQMNWGDAQTQPTNYNRCGLSSGWRVPTRRELLSIVNYGGGSPMIDGSYFPGTQPNHYWSSDQNAQSSDQAWIVSFSDSSSGFDNKTGSYYVRLVHGTSPGPSFTDNGNGTVTDNATGLMWDQCAWGQSGNDCTGNASTHNWQAALGVPATANASNHRGYNDWRLPNIKELESLVNLTKSQPPAIDTSFFPNTPSNTFWSGSPVAIDSNVAWNVNFYYGNSNVDDRNGVIPRSAGARGTVLWLF